MKIIVHVAVPIKKPFAMDKTFFHTANSDFSFDTINRFVMYKGSDTSMQLGMDDQNQWWFFTSLSCNSLTDCKYARQLFRLEYMQDSINLPLKEKLKNLNLEISDTSFDKGFIHSSMLVENIGNVSALAQSRLANNDGDDDPQITKRIHFIENVFQHKRTRFIAGEETYSFATITDNEYYFEKIHVPTVALLYLQYFVYYTTYQTIPSKQMMPRLLGNLWASKQAFNQNWNRDLLTIEPIES
jgi:hypothetical protein